MAAWVKALPYARPSQPGLAAVPLEARGTCSTKHALLAAIAAGHGIQGVELCLGIYEMRVSNTPGAGVVLDAHGLESIPEAHCYLKYGGQRYAPEHVWSIREQCIAALTRQATTAR